MCFTLYLVDKVEHSVNKDVESWASWNQKGPPPPPVVLIVRRDGDSCYMDFLVNNSDGFLGEIVKERYAVNKDTFWELVMRNTSNQFFLLKQKQLFYTMYVYYAL